tara:strand:+ start:478 stop:969 length:492 start_codon:yes stop_codon:yes gene_type:complete
MAYIGRTVEYGNAVTQQIPGAARPDYVLTYDTVTDGVVISLDGVVQVNGTDFNIVGTALTFTSDVASGIVINVIYMGLTISVGVPADGTITSAKLEASLLDSIATPSEIYGFNVDANGHLTVTTTNSGADDISGATYSGFEDVVIASVGLTWSLVGTQLRCTT